MLEMDHALAPEANRLGDRQMPGNKEQDKELKAWNKFTKLLSKINYKIGEKRTNSRAGNFWSKVGKREEKA